MALVSYSDSEESGDEEPQKSSKQNSSALGSAQLTTNFAVDKTNPRKIRVNLQETKADPPNNVGAPDEEPAPKRQRTGGGAFSGFNSMLPAPKRDAQPRDGSGSAKGQPRKIFSLKTGAERGFDRESDAELKQFFAEQHVDIKTPGTNGADAEPSASVSQSNFNFASTSIAPKSGNPMMFKPLSVARKPPKKKPSTNTTKETAPQARSAPYVAPEESAKPTPKVSLFSTGGNLPAHAQSAALTTEYQPLVYEAAEENQVEPGADLASDETYSGEPSGDTGHGESNTPAVSQSLDAIASDLNLSASARRQLFGRKPGASNNAINVINFNTDKEYAANEVLRASGEQIQHNPVRGPASGKHSLKQLVSMATGQKDALEESFATGRQNKKEAGSRYGW
jgi:Mitotic checkpoint regulator, MAD2B-interacting